SGLGENASSGVVGSVGAVGNGGYDGQPGAAGRTSIEIGDVAGVFGALPEGVERL
ncbi:MAG: hydrolase, partial [Deltaproteobacteria bacterium]|nr:hydrolase [Nannocystaceae bacterium]